MMSPSSTPNNSDRLSSKSPAPSWRCRLIQLWQTDVPLNARTLMFCFLAGSIWSIPVGLLLVTRWEVFAAPLWTAPFYLFTVSTALLALPLWSFFGWRDQPLLRSAGVVFPPCAVVVAVILSRIPGLN